MFKNITITLILLLGALSMATGQIRTPAASPSAKVSQTVGLTDIDIVYSRPSAKGRTIFAADGIVPFGAIWRTGANQATKITFSDAVTVEGKELAAGSYAILTKPGASSWDVHFYDFKTGNWGSYVELEPAAVVTVSPVNLPFNVETFGISVEDISSEGAVLALIWADVMVGVKVGVEVESRVMADIDRVMAGPSANDYFNAASYLHESGKDLNKALRYVQKATSGDSPKFWQVRREALILADLGKNAEAVAAAKKSLTLAKEAGNDDYVRMNEKSIQKWSM
ncbi:MAG: hypothetical protein ACI9P5_004708 [Saprospiraceae bacterium]|jgi:hypothetical protein